MNAALLPADVLLITVNEHETRAVMTAFGERPPKTVAGFAYFDYGVINGARVVHTISGMGATDPGAMRDTTERAIKAFQPWAVIAVGIAWGADEDEQKIGDILVSSSLHLGGHRKLSNGTREDRGPTPPASKRLRNLFHSARLVGWSGTRVREGTLITEETLFNDRAAKLQALEQCRGALGGEMEGSGLYGAAGDDVDWIVVKAICDWGYNKQNPNKENDQKLAADNAACLVHHALSVLSFTHPSRDTSTAGAIPKLERLHRLDHEDAGTLHLGGSLGVVSIANLYVLLIRGHIRPFGSRHNEATRFAA